jgi:predicted  nucleic acid-binding Zn-ribbon protein
MTTIEQDHGHTERKNTWGWFRANYDGQTCPKCGDETYRDARDQTIHYCPMCGWRYYPRIDIAESIQDHKEKIHSTKIHNRTYGEIKCPCGVMFTRKSPSQEFHTKKCRKEGKG